MTEPVRTLIAELIDYAGLFPPAGLDMAPAVANYARYREGPDGWMLGRFVVPAARLGKFADASGGAWKLAVLMGSTPEADAEKIAAFGGRAVIDTVEVKVARVEEIAAAKAFLPREVKQFFELPLGDGLPELVAAVAACDGCAKVRTGGVRPDLFPAPARLAEFLCVCAGRRVRFKATAGLHHAVRAVRPLTYEPGSAKSLMYGFLNMFLAATAAWAGAEPDPVRLMLEECDPSAFRFEEEGIAWRDLRLSTEILRAARREFAASFGSCSFEEPTDELRALGLL